MVVRRGPSELKGESLKIRFLIQVLGPAVYFILASSYRTAKKFWINKELEDRFVHINKPVILAHYHYLDIFYFFNFQNSHHAIMCGDRWGGMLGASLMARVGIETVRRTTRTRDSSSPGFISGDNAKDELSSMIIKEKYNAAMSVDGPKGPKFIVKKGVIDLAEKTGAPILTMSVASNPRVTVPTWDRMPLPIPFSKIAYIYGGPFIVPKGTDDIEKENLRRKLETHMIEINDLCERASSDRKIMADLTDGKLETSHFTRVDI